MGWVVAVALAGRGVAVAVAGWGVAVAAAGCGLTDGGTVTGVGDSGAAGCGLAAGVGCGVGVGAGDGVGWTFGVAVSTGDASGLFAATGTIGWGAGVGGPAPSAQATCVSAADSRNRRPTRSAASSLLILVDPAVPQSRSSCVLHERGVEDTCAGRHARAEVVGRDTLGRQGLVGHRGVPARHVFGCPAEIRWPALRSRSLERRPVARKRWTRRHRATVGRAWRATSGDPGVQRPCACCGRSGDARLRHCSRSEQPTARHSHQRVHYPGLGQVLNRDSDAAFGPAA